ncbi:MAG: FAD-binding protein [Acidimicrobiia bacterium]
MSEGSAVIDRRTVSIDGRDAVAPVDEEELALLLDHASNQGMRVAIRGGGTHRDIGYPVEADLTISTAALGGIFDWKPDDLTVVVGAGTPVVDLESELAGQRQSAVLPEQPGRATVGGIVATGTSAYRRLRYGPTRDRMLEVHAVTGDGRRIKGGGRVVKNVSGYDLPRLFTGSLGSLGVITSVCFKLWPRAETSATVHLSDPERVGAVYRPLAVLEDRGGMRVLLEGTGSEVEDQVRRLGGETEPGLTYPEALSTPAVWSVRVRPSLLGEALGRLPDGSEFIAQHRVGEVSFGVENDFDPSGIREWAESSGGRVVRIRGRGEVDPWGSPPAGLDLQRRVVAAFDPRRILESGRLPGGV